MEGYKVIASHWGKFVRRVEEKERFDFDKPKLDFSNNVIHGDFEDV